jgi:transcriptional regulator with XRE-family HTH domain
MIKKDHNMRGDRLREIRELRQYSQRELAVRCGMGEKQIFRYENGENDPTADTLAKIAKELSVTTDYLLGLTDDPDGSFKEEDLSAMERKLIIAVREGRIVEALQTFTSLSEDSDSAAITSK